MLVTHIYHQVAAASHAPSVVQGKIRVSRRNKPTKVGFVCMDIQRSGVQKLRRPGMAFFNLGEVQLK
jgi:hypothetical protein